MSQNTLPDNDTAQSDALDEIGEFIRSQRPAHLTPTQKLEWMEKVLAILTSEYLGDWRGKIRELGRRYSLRTRKAIATPKSAK